MTSCNCNHVWNQHGGLTLVALPGFINEAQRIKKIIEGWKGAEGRIPTTVDIAIPEHGYRVNGEPYVLQSEEHICGHDCVVLASGPGTPELLIQLYLTLCYMVGRHAARIMLVVNYMPLTRSDKDEGEDELALISPIVHLLEAGAYGDLGRIVTVDLHAEQEVGVGSKSGLVTEVSLARKLLRLVVGKIVADHPGERVVLMFPDDGARKRFKSAVKRVVDEIAKQLGVEITVVFGQKRRESSRSSDLIGIGGEVESLRGAHVIIFDDELAEGGTANNTAKAIKEPAYGALSCTAVVPHGVLCGKAASLLSSPDSGLDHIYVSDTIPVENRPALERLTTSGKLTVMPWCEDLAEIIYRLHWNKDIRSMR